jgi:uncharacterized protein
VRLNLRRGRAVDCRQPEVDALTPQEEQLINSLAERVNSTQLQEKDPDAEALLNRALASNPDALYILAQTVLVQNIALEQARAQVSQLQQAQQSQSQQPARATSFLGGLLGHHSSSPAPQPVASQPIEPAYVPPPPPPNYGQPQYQQQPPQYAPVASGPPSFLRGAMQTAAGMAAGALAFEGVEAVLHGLGGFGHPGFGWNGPGLGLGSFGMGPGMGMMGAGLERPVEENVVNNYYDQPAPGHEGLNQGGLTPGGEEQHFADQSGAQFSDASYDSTPADAGTNDQGNFDNSGFGDDSGYDNSGQDDNSAFDSGGGFDDGGGGDVGGGDLL